MKRKFFALVAAALVLRMGSGVEPSAAATTESAVVVPSDPAPADDFGAAVALQGTTLAVGAPFADIGGVSGMGAVYVFELVGGLWTQVQKLTASDGTEFDLFGAAVAISGDRMVIGAEEANIGANNAQGAAYVFERTAGVWTEVHKLAEPTTIQNVAEYGNNVDIDGDWIVIGAAQAGSAAHGRAFVYRRDEGGPGAWGQVAELEDDIFDTNASFGSSVDIEGDLLVVGALMLDKVAGTYENEGGAYVFRRDAANNWGQVGKLFRTGAAGNERAGCAVALEGATIVMGGYSANGAGIARGAAWVFENPTQTVDGWIQVAELLAGDGEDTAFFGDAVAMLGDDIWVGALEQGAAYGQAYRYNRGEGGAGNWGEAESYVASSPASNDWLGCAIAVTADHVAVGAFGLGTGGAVLVYPAPGSGGGTSAVSETPPAPVQVSAYPNPFNPATTLAFSVDRKGEVEVLIHDLRGALVARVFRGEMEAGAHEVTWRADGLPSGVYLATVRAGAAMRTTQVSLVK